jgi:GTP-dependent phosphoenolpyruvate carboxykinase
LLRVDAKDGEQELVGGAEFLQKFGERFPLEIREKHEKLSERLQSAACVAR